MLKLAAYINAHRNAVTISGSTIEMNDNKVKAEINALLQGINAKGRQLQEVERRVRIVLTGS